MKYAVIQIKGHQYKVSEGDEILVDRVAKDEGIDFKTLLFVDGERVNLGKPNLNKAKIVIKNLGEEKGKKLYVKKYKAKSRYRRKIGFRASLSRLLVEKISIS